VTLRLFASALAARDYFPLLRWMIFTGVTVFGFAIAWRYGLFQLMMTQDQTRISAFICILYAVISVHCLVAILAISREINDVGSKLSSVAIGNSIRMKPTIVPSRPSFNRASPAKAPNCIGDLSLSARPRSSKV
jgi:hypothetical protein